jgi:hypothetical protein
MQPSDQFAAVLEIFLNSARLQIRYMSVPWTDPRAQLQPPLAQLRSFSACVDVMEAVFATFNSIPLTDYIGIPFTVYSQLRLCLGMLLHLSTMDCPGWDRMDVRRRVDVIDVADQMIGNFSKASALYSGCDEGSARDDSMARIASHLKNMRNAFAGKIEQSDGEGIAFAPTPTSAEDFSLTELPDMADFLDLDWIGLMG